MLTYDNIDPSVKEALSYNERTGVFTWVRPKGSATHGKKAGSIHTGRSDKKYIKIGFNGRTYNAHRLAWYFVHGEFPRGQIDHISGDTLDNSISNLRDVDAKENQRNAKIRSDNSTGLQGVNVRPNGKYQARISTGEKRLSLGCFSTLFDAACARKSAEFSFGFHENHGRAT